MSAYYVEFLRVARAMRVVAILLGVVLLGALLLRFSWGAPQPAKVQVDPYGIYERSPTAHVTKTKLPHGITRTVVDDPKREVYAIIDRRGSTTVAFTVAHTKEAAEDAARVLRAPNSTTIVDGPQGAGWVTYPTQAGLGELFGFTLPIAMFVATLLAGPLAKENNGHLEVAWTRPVSRQRYALTAILVDIAGVLVAQVITAFALVVAMSFWTIPRILLQTGGGMTVAYMIAIPIAWYAFLTGWSASLKRGPGIVLGIGWALALIVPWIAGATNAAPTALGRAVHALFLAVEYVIPPSYLWSGLGGATSAVRETEIGLGACAALTVIYLALALVQWRRLEA